MKSLLKINDILCVVLSVLFILLVFIGRDIVAEYHLFEIAIIILSLNVIGKLSALYNLMNK